jgi:hypothetical protein
MAVKKARKVTKKKVSQKQHVRQSVRVGTGSGGRGQPQIIVVPGGGSSSSSSGGGGGAGAGMGPQYMPRDMGTNQIMGGLPIGQPQVPKPVTVPDYSTAISDLRREITGMKADWGKGLREEMQAREAGFTGLKDMSTDQDSALRKMIQEHKAVTDSYSQKQQVLSDRTDRLADALSTYKDMLRAEVDTLNRAQAGLRGDTAQAFNQHKEAIEALIQESGALGNELLTTQNRQRMMETLASNAFTDQSNRLRNVEGAAAQSEYHLDQLYQGAQAQGMSQQQLAGAVQQLNATQGQVVGAIQDLHGGITARDALHQQTQQGLAQASDFQQRQMGFNQGITQYLQDRHAVPNGVGVMQNPRAMGGMPVVLTGGGGGGAADNYPALTNGDNMITDGSEL